MRVYILTMTFEAETDDDADEAVQLAGEAINEAPGCAMDSAELDKASDTP